MKETNKFIAQINNSLLFNIGTSYLALMKDKELNDFSDDFKREITFYLYLASKFFKDIESLMQIENELADYENKAAKYVINKLNHFYRLNMSIKKHRGKIRSIRLETFIEEKLIKLIENEKDFSQLILGQKLTEKITKNIINYYYAIDSFNELDLCIDKKISVLPVFDELEIKGNIQSHLIAFNEEYPHLNKLGIFQRKYRPSLTIFEKLPTRKMFKPSSWVIY